MKSVEPYVSEISEFYVYFPSSTARRIFFYPICIGNFVYEAGYQLFRSSYDGFLFIYIKSGFLDIEYKNKVYHAETEDFVFIDCKEEHSYHTNNGCECLWCHMDGVLVKDYYQIIIEQNTNVFKIFKSYIIYEKMYYILNQFISKIKIEEAIISKTITDIFTIILTNSNEDKTESDAIKDIALYIHNHFCENISVKELSKKAMISHYYFIRLFKKKTGYTPYEYLINVRLSNAKYLLSTSCLSIKEVCFRSGFSCESTFCTTFKKNVGLTPAEYRNK